MNYQKLLFSEQTPYQVQRSTHCSDEDETVDPNLPKLVEIYLTADFGAMLVLDGYTNLAESDLAYTHNLMCHGVQVQTMSFLLLMFSLAYSLG